MIYCFNLLLLNMNKFEIIENTVYKAYDRHKSEISLRSRKSEHKEPRFATWYLLDRVAGISKAEQGRHYYRNHTTIRNGINRVSDIMSTDRMFKLKIQGLINECSYALGELIMLPQAKFAFRKEINAVVHICPMCDKYIMSLSTKRHTYCSECGTKIKLEI